MKQMSLFIIGVVGTLLFVGIFSSLTSHVELAMDANFLLTVVSTAGTLGGIAFALYGWYSSKELPKLVDATVEQRIRGIKEQLDGELVRQQEAMQKVIASYGMNGPEQLDQKIALLKSAVEIYPAVYNGYVSLAYAYWYEKADYLAAEECFRRDLEYHPSNYQSANDLAVLFASQKEWISALSWIKETLEKKPSAWQDIEADTRLDELRASQREHYDRMLENAKKRTSDDEVKQRASDARPAR